MSSRPKKEEVVYSYTILSRSPGNPHPVLYSGTVEASTSKEALLNALAQEFGINDSNGGDAFEALTMSGWLDADAIAERFGSLFDDDKRLCLDTGEHTFDVEVSISTE